MTGLPAKAGGSLIFVMVIVAVVVADWTGVPLSVAAIVRTWAPEYSKSGGTATVMAPVVGFRANRPAEFPPVMLYVIVCPALGSVAVMVPTVVPTGEFSASVK